MAVDTKQKRYSAIAVSQPWRNAPIDPTEVGFGASNRAAAAYSYAIEAGAPAPADNGIGGSGISDGTGITLTIRITGISGIPGISMDIT